MEETEAMHHPARQSRFEGLSRMLAVKQAGIAQEMDVDERQQEDQAEAAA
jgi:hypothetical protein